MFWLTGSVGAAVVPFLDARRVGVMAQPRARFARAPLAESGWTWAADNGAFGQGFDLAKWQEWITDPVHNRETCLFAAVPDVVGDARATRRLFYENAHYVRDGGYRVAYVAQDGSDKYPPPWDEFDVLFIGGTDDFKFEPPGVRLMARAHHLGKPVHVGRVNGLRGLNKAREQFAETADGTFLKFAPDENVGRMERWLDSMASRPVLWEAL